MIDTVVFRPEVLSSEICNVFLKDLNPEQFTPAVISGADNALILDSRIRQSAVYWLPDGHWLALLLYQLLQDVSQDMFGFELTGHENVQVTRYQPGEFYRWHCDQFWPPPNQEEVPLKQQVIRKLSVCLQLSPSSEYHGGDLLLQEPYGLVLSGNGRAEEWRAQGSAVIFPSVIQHCVTPVTTGVRFSAVLWATGPVWR